MFGWTEIEENRMESKTNLFTLFFTYFHSSFYLSLFFSYFHLPFLFLSNLFFFNKQGRYHFLPRRLVWHNLLLEILLIYHSAFWKMILQPYLILLTFVVIHVPCNLVLVIIYIYFSTPLTLRLLSYQLVIIWLKPKLSLMV